jgi:hypothetical protein
MLLCLYTLVVSQFCVCVVTDVRHFLQMLALYVGT